MGVIDRQLKSCGTAASCDLFMRIRSPRCYQRTFSIYCKPRCLYSRNITPKQHANCAASLFLFSMIYEALQPPMTFATARNRLNPKTRGQSQQVQDLQIWRLHQKIVEKIEQEPSLCQQVQQRLELRLEAGQVRHAEYLYWSCLLLEVHQFNQFRDGVLSMEPRICKYRRRTPFVGILTEQERQQILYGDLQIPQ